MNFTSFLLLGLAPVLACTAAETGTNDCLLSSLFFKPSIQLRHEQAAPATVSEPRNAEPAAAALQASDALDKVALPARFAHTGTFYLTRTQPEFDNGFDRFVDNVFRPEVFRIGKLPANCSLWTAIKRKNPLCLLNPIVFQLSW